MPVDHDTTDHPIASDLAATLFDWGLAMLECDPEYLEVFTSDPPTGENAFRFVCSFAGFCGDESIRELFLRQGLSRPLSGRA